MNTFNKMVTFKEIETFLQTLSAVRSTDDATVRLPHKLSQRIGVEVALIQAILTWSQSQTVPVLRTYIQSAERAADGNSSSITDSAVGLCAATLSKSIQDAGGREIRAQVWSRARQTVEQMESGVARFQRGASFAAVAFDGTSRPAPCPLYAPSGSVLAREDASALLEQTLLGPAGAGLNLDQKRRLGTALPSLCTLLYEIFRNTHAWARTRVDGVPIRRNARGVLIRQYRGSKSEMASQHASTPAMKAYIETLAERTKGDRMRLLELSVFDGGPGLVRRFTRQQDLNELTSQREVQVIAESFARHATTSNAAHRGEGLEAAISELNAVDGFLRLRTGRISVHRDFGAIPRGVNEPLGESGDNATTGLPPVAGTVFTFVVPLDPKKDEQ